MINQIAVFLENRTGRLSEMCKILAENNINLAAVSLADASDYGVVRLLTYDNELAKEVLTKAGFVVSCNDLLAFHVDDKPGGLAKILKILEEENIFISYLYTLGIKDNKALILIKVDDLAKTKEILKKKSIETIDNTFL